MWINTVFFDSHIYMDFYTETKIEYKIMLITVFVIDIDRNADV